MSVLQKLLHEADLYKEKTPSTKILSDEVQRMTTNRRLSDACAYIINQAHQAEPNITEETLKNLHLMLLPSDAESSLFNYRTGPAKDPGTGRIPPDAEDVPRLMGHLSDQIHSSCAGLHPIELAAMAHKRLMDIQPFPTENQPTAELLMNLILVHYGYGAVILQEAGTGDYMKALTESVQLYDMEPFAVLCAKCVVDSLKKQIDH